MIRRIEIEAERLALQADLDAGKTQPARNKLGQFATPGRLADELVRHALTLMGKGCSIRFLDPAAGTGAFISAIQRNTSERERDAVCGYEIDPYYGVPTQELWRDQRVDFRLGDFTRTPPPSPGHRFNLIVANPPYVRHHHLESSDKKRLQTTSFEAAGMALSGLAGLHCHFLALTHAWMMPGALACWLIPSEFMDVNYGREVKRYLLERVTLLRIHRFDPTEVQFDDALVSSAVVWFRNTPPPTGHTVEFTFGGTHETPRVRSTIPSETLGKSEKWTRFPVSLNPIEYSTGVRLRDLFEIRRGIATGNNDIFILSPERVAELGLPESQLTPILPSPRYLETERVDADAKGFPQVARAGYLINCRLDEPRLRERHPSLFKYLESQREAATKGFLCSRRSPWYLQEERAAAPILCTYMGRGGAEKKPFRFILNRSKAVATNTFLNLYPTASLASRLEREPALLERIWRELNSLDASSMKEEGRVYGGGLHKMEPKELANVPVPALADLAPHYPVQTRLEI